MAKQPYDQSWREWVLNNSLPRNEATTEPAATGFTPATAADFGPIIFRGDRPPDDAAALLPDAAATKMIALGQRAADLFAQVPTLDEVQEVRLEVTGYKNRIADLTRHKSEGGFGLDASAPQVVSESHKLARAEKELARRAELKETRGVRWTAAGQLRQSVNDWVLRGIPGDCTLDVIADQPVSELMTKADGGRIDAAVERYRLRLRELAADAHRVRSSPWPSSVAKTAAHALIDQLADAGQPDFDRAIEFGQDIGFSSVRVTSQVYNITNSPGAIAYAEADNAIGLMCWLFKDQIFSKICAGLDEISDDKHALDQRQREEMLATIASDSLAAERSECSLIWHAAAERGEIIDFRPTTTPAAAIGVVLRTVPRGDDQPPGSSWMHAYDIVQPGGGRR